MQTPAFFPLTRRSFLIGSAAALSAAGMVRFANGQESRQLRIGISSYPPNFDPWANVGTAAETVKLQSFRGLLSYAPDGSLRSELAESWALQGDSVYEFKLRENVKFHNGDSVTAEEVKFSFERMAVKDSGALMQSFFEGLTIEVIDELNLRITLPKPNVTALYSFASYDAPVFSKRSFEEDPTQTSGAGPYKITGSERGAWIELEAVEGFYRPELPKSKSIRFIAYPDENARVAALEAGDVDLIEYVPALSMASIGSNPNLALDVVGGPATSIMFNCETGPFADPLVRQAVGYAIDRQAVIDGAFAGNGVPAGALPVQPTSEFYDPELENYFARDVEKAKALLAEAGFPNGLKTALLATSTYSVHKDPAIVIQQQLAEVGIEAELLLPDWPTRVKLAQAGQYEIVVSAISTENNDPSMFRALVSSAVPNNQNKSWGYKNERLDQLFDDSLSTSDVEARKAIFKEIGQEFVKDPGFIGVCFRPQAYARSAEVKGFTNLPGFLSFYSGISIEDVSIG